MAWVKTGSYDGATRIETPHDPDARWSKKRTSGWTGHKLQVTETDDVEFPHLITDIAVTSAEVGDTTALADIRQRQKERDVLPGERYADCGYVGGETLVKGRKEFDEELDGAAPARYEPAAASARRPHPRGLPD